MTICNVCGNHYDQFPHWGYAVEAEAFDSFECAFYDKAPICACCGGQINHGLEVSGVLFCCTHCIQEYQSASIQKPAYRYATEINLALDKALMLPSAV
jgi:hypothetical protein